MNNTVGWLINQQCMQILNNLSVACGKLNIGMKEDSDSDCRQRFIKRQYSSPVICDCEEQLWWQLVSSRNARCERGNLFINFSFVICLSLD